MHWTCRLCTCRPAYIGQRAQSAHEGNREIKFCSVCDKSKKVNSKSGHIISNFYQRENDLLKSLKIMNLIILKSFFLTRYSQMFSKIVKINISILSNLDVNLIKKTNIGELVILINLQ